MRRIIELIAPSYRILNAPVPHEPLTWILTRSSPVP